MIGEFAGPPAGSIPPGRLLALPAAAMIRQPAANAAEPAAVHESWGGIRAPRDTAEARGSAKTAEQARKALR